MGAKRKAKSIRWLIASFVVFLFLPRAVRNLHLQHRLHDLRTELAACTPPTLFVHVTTCCRPHSLRRLLNSLERADYGSVLPTIDLHVEIDWVPQEELGGEHERTISLAREFPWSYGLKTFRQRVQKAGLATMWFELSIPSQRDYIMILEDDVELSRHYFTFVATLHCKESISKSSTTALCLHPNDWQIGVAPKCGESSHSNLLYETPEPCNWAPVWKSSAWYEYVTWLHNMLATQRRPFVTDWNNMSYNYNAYVERGVDVQSPWVWKYNWENSKLQVRYSFTRCRQHHRELYFAINHKEPGTHFKKKLHLENDPSLLEFSFEVASVHMLESNVFKPSIFTTQMLIPRQKG